MSAQGRLSRSAVWDPRTLEQYIRAQMLPRFITRLREIEDRLLEHRLALEGAYRQLQLACGEDRDLFERGWTETARTWRFDEVNDLIREHNEYYPIERRLPFDPRTGDYVTISGRPYEREPVGAEWVLERFPARPADLGAGYGAAP